MNHLINKFKIAGALGGKPKPKPATLLPPELGVHQLGSSFSYAEILDLISDGPIAGLVNQNNSRVDGLAALQGIYMDDIPVAVTNDQTAEEQTTSSFAFYETATPKIASYISDLGTKTRETELQPNGVTSYDQGFEVYNFGVGTDRANTYLYINISGWSRQNQESSIQYTKSGFDNKIVFFVPKDSRINKSLNLSIKSNPENIVDDVFQIAHLNQGFINTEKTDVLTLYEKQYTDRFFIDKPQNLNVTDYIKNQIQNITQIKEINNTNEEARFDTVSALYVDASIITFNALQNPRVFIDEDGNVKTDLILSLDPPSGFQTVEILNYAYPELDENGDWNGKMQGFVIYFLKTIYKRNKAGATQYSSIYIEKSNVGVIANARNFIVGPKIKSNSKNSQKYNYTNILTEIKKGEEDQKPFRYFNNVYIDKTYDSRLLGPFRTSGQVQKLYSEAAEDTLRAQKVLTSNFEFNNPTGKQKGLPIDEGSNDARKKNNDESPNYSAWDKNLISYDEEPISVTHFVENPNVESVIVSLGIDSLNDTANIDIKQGNGNPKKIDAGSRFPGVVNIEIEIGKVNEKGVTIQHYKKRYQIIALVESPATVDIGNPDSKNFESSSYKFIKDLDKDAIESGVFDPLKLPSAFDVSGPEETPTRRYVKVTKLSTETNSILVSKEVSLKKVTEIVPVNCSYPFSSMIGIKLDARTFGSIPTRTFDARLKLIKIPSNYYPVKDNILETDKRYYTSVVDYENATTEDKSVYKGDWDGTFKIGWTDNPAWILYDLLTNNRYGLGQYINEDDINKWDLYKIGRFCDSVDEEGLFVGVPDGRGGLEPRYSCNIIFTEGTKVFDSINQISNLFRGSVFYNNNEINFLDDRLREPSALFSNSNVKDGIFSYTNYRRDEQFNSIEVVYIDRFDSFKTKIEYVEDEEDIVQRGMFKKQVNAYGVTSKAMANRIGRHLIYQTIKENQSVSFMGGNEVLLCKPGDLIIIEDELKSLKSNFGRVLGVDASAKTVRINEPFITGEYTSGITLYSPTGQSTSEDIDAIANLERERLTGFSITGNAGGVLDDFTGVYKFSGYSDGFSGRFEDEGLFEEFALYTGDRTPQNIIYYSTLATGWVFSTGLAFENDNEYDKIIGETGSKSILSLSTGGFDLYDSATAGYRVIGGSGFSGDFDNSNGDISIVTKGALESEISLVTTPQIITLSITGAVNQDYGSLLYVDSGDINANLLGFVTNGSSYRIQRQNADDQIYKILEMREEAPNEYAVVATKYDSGKFDLIENSVSIEFQSDTFGYGVNNQINDTNYVTLDTPVIDSITTGDGSEEGYYISGNWQSVSNATGYHAILYRPSFVNPEEVYISETGFSFDNNTEIGNYTLTVKALGDNSKNAGTRYYDSKITSSGISILPGNSDLYTLSSSVIAKFTIQ